MKRTKKLTREQFNALPNYSCSNPTGTTIGKCWKRARNYKRQTDNPQDWIHCEFVPCDKPGHIGIQYSAIYILDPVEEIISKRLFG